ncbi:MAG TPA: penicillin-binding protein 2 [Acidimicrobiales bacterium]|nr:penicillin-binding protein 2 [Acidimicrobiales bacterium]
MFVLGAVALAGLFVRVAVLQVFEAAGFVAEGERQRVRSTPLPAARGAIFDRNGFELAISGPRTTLWADPRLVEDPAATTTALTPLLGLGPEQAATLTERLSTDAEFVYVARQVDDVVAQQVLDLELPGLAGYAEPKRFYPNGSLAAGVLGATDPDGNGISGLELLYDEVLAGEPGELIRERSSRGNTIPTGRFELVPARAGDDLVLTIDRALQYKVEQLLRTQVANVGARGGTVVVMRTDGDIVAMANVRVDRETGRPEVTNANLAAVDTFEPGSVAKIVTAAGALNDGVATPQSVFEVPYQRQFFDVRFTDGIPHGNEMWTLTDIITKSSNIGTMLVSEQLGVPRMEHYLRSFGFGERTGLGFPGEAAGILEPAEEWQGTEKVTVAYGYGVAVTGVQLVAAMNAIANGGEYVSPRLVEATISAEGEARPTPDPERQQVLRPDVAEQLNLILRDVICRGTAKEAQMEGYTVAGKTGTAYKARDAGGYTDVAGNRKYYASFAGFLPAEDPQLTILVSIDEPPQSGDHYGGLVSAPLFVQVAKEAVSRFQIPPTTTGPTCAPPG